MSSPSSPPSWTRRSMLSSRTSLVPDSSPERPEGAVDNSLQVDWVAHLDSSKGDVSLRLVSASGGLGPRIAEAAGCTLLFSGGLARDVLNEDAARPGDEDRVLSGFLRDGPALFSRLRGR